MIGRCPVCTLPLPCFHGPPSPPKKQVRPSENKYQSVHLITPLEPSPSILNTSKEFGFAQPLGADRIAEPSKDSLGVQSPYRLQASYSQAYREHHQRDRIRE